MARTRVGETTPDTAHAGLLRDVEFSPVFIIGDHRTGTTVLSEVLAATQRFNNVTAYHIIDFGELVHNHVNGLTEARKAELGTLLAERGLRDRGIDGVQASPDTPEEYGFILRNERLRPKLSPANVEDLRDLCKKVALTSDAPRPVLLKNPWDCLNFMFVREAFPDARFVFIHRNPVHTVNSQLQSTRAIFAKKNEYVALVADWYEDLFHHPWKLRLFRSLFSPRWGIAPRLVVRHVARATSYFMAHEPLLTDEGCISIRYEDLCQQPRQTVGSILRQLGLEEASSVDYEGMIKPRSVSLLLEVEKRRTSIHSRMKPYLDRWGFDPRD